MIQIHKHSLTPGITTIQTREKYKILSSITQVYQPVVYIQVDLDTPIKEVNIVSIPTGEVLNINMDTLKFIDTITLDNLVFHIFEMLD